MRKKNIDKILIALYDCRPMVGRIVTTAKAAIILGVSDARVRQLIKEKKLVKVEKEGRDWLLDKAEIKAFVKQPRGKRGAPRRRVFLG